MGEQKQHFNHQIHPVVTDSEIQSLFPLLREVCPDIHSESELLSKARFMIDHENCHFIYIKDNVLDPVNNPQSLQVPVSFAGYRILSSLSKGNFMHIHYVGTLPSAKRRGYANALVDWVIEKAHELNCNVISLNSGHGRREAHKLYMNKNFYLKCHHFCLELKPLH